MLAISPPDVQFQAQTSQNHKQSTSSVSVLHMPRPGLIATMRPKLSLQTSSLPITYGRSSTSQAVPGGVLDTTTPTTFNTFSNAYDIAMPIRPSPTASAKLTPKYTRPSLSPSFTSMPPPPYPSHAGIKSILRNPCGPKLPKRTATFNRAGGPQTHLGLPFQQPRRPKRVSFHPSLEEEIVTRKFVARHSDLSSSPTDTTTAEREEDSDVDEEGHSGVGVSRKRKIDAPSSDKKMDHVRGRPVSGAGGGARNRSLRRKKRRWEWTLEAKELVAKTGQQQTAQA